MISNRLAKADPGLADLFPAVKSDEGFAGAAFHGQAVPEEGIELIVVLNRDTPPDRLAKLRWRRITRGIFSVPIQPAQFDILLACPEVETVHGPQPMQLTLDRSTHAMNVEALRAEDKPPRTGKNVVIGIVDYGFDLTHPDFLDKHGNTRVAYFWDQTQKGGAHSPYDFGYGVEYNADRINHALRQADPFSVLGHKPPAKAHGTHVAGIAAGTGSEDGQRCSGVAPDAHLVFVNLPSEGEWNIIHDSKVIDALAYIFRKAEEGFEEEQDLWQRARAVFRTVPARKLPCVVNLSVSKNDGGHDAGSLIELGIDRMLGETMGKAVVVAAGNTGDAALHSEWRYARGESIELQWVIPEVAEAEQPKRYKIELWYSSRDEIGAQLIAPDGGYTPVVQPTTELKTNVGPTLVRVLSTRFTKPAGDARIVIEILKPVVPGTWTIRLTAGERAHAGVLHAWIDDSPPVPHRARFANAVETRCTIGTPATSRYCISVGNINHTADPRTVTAGSGRGPTRDLREKPDVVAPGVNISSSCSLGNASAPEGLRFVDSGTSMSAPHITGLIACLFQEHPTLTATEVRQVLIAAADGDAHDGAVGYGMVDAGKALQLVANYVASGNQ